MQGRTDALAEDVQRFGALITGEPGETVTASSGDRGTAGLVDIPKRQTTGNAGVCWAGGSEPPTSWRPPGRRGWRSTRWVRFPTSLKAMASTYRAAMLAMRPPTPRSTSGVYTAVDCLTCMPNGACSATHPHDEEKKSSSFGVKARSAAIVCLCVCVRVCVCVCVCVCLRASVPVCVCASVRGAHAFVRVCECMSNLWLD